MEQNKIKDTFVWNEPPDISSSEVRNHLFFLAKKYYMIFIPGGLLACFMVTLASMRHWNAYSLYWLALVYFSISIMIFGIGFYLLYLYAKNGRVITVMPLGIMACMSEVILYKKIYNFSTSEVTLHGITYHCFSFIYKGRRFLFGSNREFSKEQFDLMIEMINNSLNPKG